MEVLEEGIQAAGRQLASAKDAVSEECVHSLFSIVKYSNSLKVVQCFLFLIAVTIVIEICLEHLEDTVHGTVTHDVLQKLYKELMLLGIISFGIFITLGSWGQNFTNEFVASFELSHLVLFFLGVGIILHSIWSIACNKRYQRDIWLACTVDSKKVVEQFRGQPARNQDQSSDSAASIEVNGSAVVSPKARADEGCWGLGRLLGTNHSSAVVHDVLKLQILRLIFIDVHDLPDDFSFAHYACCCLNAVTVGSIHVSPSSYFAVAVVVLISELFVRYRPRFMWKGYRSTRDGREETTALLFLGCGVLFIVVDLFLVFLLRRSIFRIIAEHFGVKTMKEAVNEFESATLRPRSSRSLSVLRHDLKAFLDPEGIASHRTQPRTSSAGAPSSQRTSNLPSKPPEAKVEDPADRRQSSTRAHRATALFKEAGEKETSAGTPALPALPSLPAPPSDQQRAGNIAAPRTSSISTAPSAAVPTPAPPPHFVSARSLRGAGSVRSSIEHHRTRNAAKHATSKQTQLLGANPKAATVAQQHKNAVIKALRWARPAFAQSMSQKEALRRKKKIDAMIKHAKGSGSGKKHRSSLLERALAVDKSWVNVDAELTSNAAQSVLPFGSLAALTSIMDGLRLLKHFFVAIFITCFIAQDWTKAPLIVAATWLGAIVALVSNLFVDPQITYYHGLVTTMVCANPLLLGETVEYMSDVHVMEEQVAHRIVERHHHHIVHQHLVSLAADGATDAAEVAPLTSESMQAFMRLAFKEWDLEEKGFLTKAMFIRGLHGMGVFFSSRKVELLFRAIDPDLNGHIVFEEFWAVMGPAIHLEIVNLQEHLRFDSMTEQLANAVREMKTARTNVQINPNHGADSSVGSDENKMGTINSREEASDLETGQRVARFGEKTTVQNVAAGSRKSRSNLTPPPSSLRGSTRKAPAIELPLSRSDSSGASTL